VTFGENPVGAPAAATVSAGFDDLAPDETVLCSRLAPP
jgi:hypothetical protein